MDIALIRSGPIEFLSFVMESLRKSLSTSTDFPCVFIATEMREVSIVYHHRQ